MVAESRKGHRWVFEYQNLTCRYSNGGPAMVYKQLRVEEREIIATMNAQGCTQAAIAEATHRDASTISRELSRNRPRSCYSASVAQGLAMRRRAAAGRPRRKFEQPEIREAVKKQLQEGWSPEQIAGVSKRQFPEDPRRWISRQTIYNSLRRDDHGRPLQKCLRRYHLHKRRCRARKERICPQLEQRPAIINERGRCGDWEGDLICSGGHDQFSLVSLVERQTGYVELILVPNKTSDVVMSAIRVRLGKHPRELRQSVTFDNGSEFSRWEWLQWILTLLIFFAHPHSPWERGTNENTNGLVREYFPKGTRFSQVTRYEVQAVQEKLNHRPRKRLDFQTPHEALSKHCCLAVQT
ncbi:IS30 family transposase [Anatilimnocola sp. NA78]|uniref:IS30 family transposase n=2 Tax=Anatilimnocola sp. NA78 TaxID=3415683 RepID=UPI003CE4E558